ncbi:MAG TPA: TIGR00730 family Rossman fold protein, partial [Spirochaetota bacterium]|nr:TIGR00730 family Rossman fold protein [Spirochaetota bacterium]
KIIGVIPEKIHKSIDPFEGVHEIIITKTMSERKSIMFDKAYGFVALPGGFGTLEEVLEIITLKQLGYVDKPITFLNTKGFYNPLLEQFEVIYKEHFAKQSNRDIYFVSSKPQEIVDYIKNYKPSKDSSSKWL